MLNPYFAFGVPLFLIALYIMFAIIRKKTTIHYVGFVLLLISSFMTVFSFQVLQELWSVENNSSLASQSKEFEYNLNFLWIPLFLGILLVTINLIRGIKRVLSFQKNSKHSHE